MKKSFISKLAMANTCIDVITSPEHAETYGGASKSFKKAVSEAQSLTESIMKTGQELDGSKGPASADKQQALVSLGDQAWSIVSSLHGVAVENDLHDLAVATDISRTDITRGSATNVINRCREFHKLAAENIDVLADDDVTAGDVTALKKAIDTFEGLQTKPRKTKATGKAATNKLDSLFGQLTKLFNKRLDKLAAKFKKTAPEFYNAYKASRVIVDPAVAKAKKDEEKKAA